MKKQQFKLNIGNKDLIVEATDIAEQANGHVFVRYGDTSVLATCVMSKAAKETDGFFPLTVEYEEKYYAAGKIKGGRFIKREAKPSDEAICNGRLIDRAIRPLFPKNINREVQVVITVLSWDAENDPDVVGLMAASLALSISDIPWFGPISTLRVCKNGEGFVLNPTYETREKAKIDLVYAGVKKGNDFLINMIEGSCEETDETSIVESFNFVKDSLKKLSDFQEEIIKKCGKEKINPEVKVEDLDFEKDVREFLNNRLEKALFQKDKLQREIDLIAVKEELITYLKEKYGDDFAIKEKSISYLFDKETDRIIHENAIQKERRCDGRKLDELREISGDLQMVPRAHGSALFCRGITKALSILTLGAPGDQQILEGMEVFGKKRFFHHYNMPPYSSGEIKPMRGPGRREIGHGMLAEKALWPIIPPAEQFPYTIRIVTEILSSNGSTSMASVSASSLALMDAGVPIKSLATGISLGLMSDESGNYKILTDIQGPEDHHGDMDFKIAGTRAGITAIQMDVKCVGITEQIFQEALERGKKTRHQILDTMEKVISEPRKELSPYAPRILTIQINPEKIKDVIGSGGKVINEIVAQTGATIDIEDSGLIYITCEKESGAKEALEWIKNITREAKVGEMFQGKVKRILDFGAFVEIFQGTEGMVHISQLANYRVNKVEDVVKVGDIIPVKVIGIDEQGRINLSLKEARKN